MVHDGGCDGTCNAVYRTPHQLLLKQLAGAAAYSALAGATEIAAVGQAHLCFCIRLMVDPKMSGEQKCSVACFLRSGAHVKAQPPLAVYFLTSSHVGGVSGRRWRSRASASGP